MWFYGLLLKSFLLVGGGYASSCANPPALDAIATVIISTTIITTTTIIATLISTNTPLTTSTTKTTTTITSTITPMTQPTTTTTTTTLTTTSTASIYMTIDIVNSYTTDLSLLFGLGTSNISGVLIAAPTPVGDPKPTLLSLSSSTHYLYPSGWSGNIVVGRTANLNGSLIEGSFTGPPDIDVSYVNGYTVPITCSSNGTVVTGCNIELLSGTCPNLADGPTCLNPARSTPDGPPTCFFAPCAGAAYTFPNDSLANVPNLPSNLVSCCIGSSCGAPARQGNVSLSTCV